MKPNSRGSKQQPITLNLTLVGTKSNIQSKKNETEKDITESNNNLNKPKSEQSKHHGSHHHRTEMDSLNNTIKSDMKYANEWTSFKNDSDNLRNIYEDLCKRQERERQVTHQIHKMERKHLEERIARKKLWSERKRQAHDESLKKLQELDSSMNDEENRIEEEFATKLEPLRQELESIRNAETVASNLSPSESDYHIETFQNIDNQIAYKKKKRRSHHSKRQDCFDSNPIALKEMGHDLDYWMEQPKLDTPKLASDICETCQEVNHGGSTLDLLNDDQCETCTAFYRLEKLRRHIKGCVGNECEKCNVTYSGKKNNNHTY